MLKEAKRLHDLGFSIIWLRPKSKAPVEKAWTKSKNKTFGEIKDSYKPSYNMGVRLGSHSKVKGKYLAVIDCDLKSKDKKHLNEMKEKLKSLGVNDAPCVMSGRANGSMHLYVLTDKPLKPKRFGQSNEKVKVKMPSVEPSKFERENLSIAELKNGIRLRAAWEISLMGEGQQVALPPSVHPDSGKAYIWYRDAKDVVMPTLKHFDTDENKKDEKVYNIDTKNLHFVDFTERLESRPDLIDLIIDGKGCSDRSASLYKVAIELTKLNFSDTEILSILSEPDYYLGKCAYDHRKTKDRSQAVDWLLKHTLKKANRAATLADDFEKPLDFTMLRDINDIERQSKDLVKSKDFTQLIERNKFDVPFPSFKNVEIVVRGLLGPKGILHNEFALEDTWAVNTPWGCKKGDAIKDIDVLMLKSYLVNHYRIEVAKERIAEVLQVLAQENSFHPVLDYLCDLEWDGVPRLDTWLVDYLGAKGHPEYLAAVGRKTLVAMVKRVFEPGCNFHYVLILEGKQRQGKSETARILGGKWFNDSAIDIRDKDAKLHIKGIWLQELAELATMHKAEQRLMKNFISVASDRLRRPYGSHMEEHKRQTVFIGTTNEREYFTDTTGNARYWPVKIERLKRDELIADRDQLFAEAVTKYLGCENIEMLDEPIAKLAERVQESKMVRDDCDSVLIDFFASISKSDVIDFDPELFRMYELVNACPNLKAFGNGRTLEMKVANLLKKMGFRNVQKRIDGTKGRWWEKIKKE